MSKHQSTAHKMVAEILSGSEELLAGLGVPPALVNDFLNRRRDRYVTILETALERREQLHGQLPELWSPKRRSEANLRALEVLAKQPTSDEDFAALAQYSGWGGLSIEKVQHAFPVGVPVPETRGLIHEYYTPTAVAQAVGKLVVGLLPTLPADPNDAHNTVQALEPSAGIGRLIHNCLPPPSHRFAWTAIEFSQVSARMLQLRSTRLPSNVSVDVHHQPFEAFIKDALTKGALPRFDLVLANPPYGQRSEAALLDPDKKLQKEQRSYIYFMKRSLEMLSPGGIGLFLVPAAFMSNRSTRATDMRREFLLHNHLCGAFRLPNEPHLIPGALVIIDILVWRRRPERLSSVRAEDELIATGKYFANEANHHVLGTESGAPHDDEQTQDRYGHKVEGKFTGLPALIERPHDIRSIRHIVQPQLTTSQLPSEALPEAIQEAILLASRLDDYTALVAQDRTREARALHGELLNALRDWVSRNGLPDTLKTMLNQLDELNRRMALRFLSAYQPSGELIPELEITPLYEPKFRGNHRDIREIAEWHYAHYNRLDIEQLFQICEKLGHPWDGDLIPLFNADWCLDGQAWNQLMPAHHYYTGNLLERLRFAQFHHSTRQDPQAHKQLLRLKSQMNTKSFAELRPINFLDGWLPIPVLEDFAKYAFKLSVTLLRNHQLLHVIRRANAEPYIEGQHENFDSFLGAINSDYLAFDPDNWPYKRDMEWLLKHQLTQENNKAQRCRAHILHWSEQFNEFLETRPDLQTMLEDEYNRLFAGFIVPEYSGAPLPIQRWRGNVQLHPHQAAGARRVLSSRRGVIAFDVGVGKTYTGIAVLARAREEGWVRRPIIVVPNTIVWKWYNDIKRACPDFQVGVIGSNRFLESPDFTKLKLRLASPDALQRWQHDGGRSKLDHYILSVLSFDAPRMLSEVITDNWLQAGDGKRIQALIQKGYLSADFPKPKYRIVADSDAQRTAKWQKFSLGAYDCLIVPYSRLGSLEVREDRARMLFTSNPAIDALLYRAANKATFKKNPDRQNVYSERQRAAHMEQMEKKLAELTKRKEKPDAIYWEDTGCDFLLVDEAQNFKNWWLPEHQPGGVPKYMGNAGYGSERAWDLALKAMDVRERTGGAGVVLLSATPFKNSPLEIYNLISYCAPELFEKVGILSPHQFIQMFCKIELIAAPNAYGIVESNKAACTGFLNYQILKDIIYRICDIKTAEMVKLSLPVPSIHLIELDMNDRQMNKYARYSKEISDKQLEAIGAKHLFRNDDGHPSDKMMILELLVKMSQVALHPSLDDYPAWESADKYDPHSPKIDECARRIIGNLYQHTIYENSDVGLALYTSPPTFLHQNHYNIVAIGNVTHGESAGELQLVRSTTGETVLIASIRVEGEFSVTLYDGQLDDASYSLRLHNIAKISVIGNSSIVSAGSPCKLPETGCRCGHIVFCDFVVVHRWLFKVLVKLGMPAERIAMLNAEVASSPASRVKLASEFNGNPEEGIPPLFDVLICNQVAYEGIDLQTRTCAIHHLDFPWEPATLSQRNGRGVRQGNTLAAIAIYYYLSKRSADGIRFNLIMGKRNWMTRLLTSMDREISNPAAQQNFDLNDLLMLSSIDPDKTKAVLEELRLRQRNEELYIKRDVVTRLLSSLSQYHSALSTVPEAIYQSIVKHADGVWSWMNTLENLWTPHPIVAIQYDLPILYVGQHLLVRPEQQPPMLIELLEKGRWRQWGSIVVEFDVVKSLLAPNRARLTDEDLEPQWDAQGDLQAIQVAIVQYVESSLANARWRDLNINKFPPNFLRLLWPTMEPHVRRLLSQRSTDAQFIPVIDAHQVFSIVNAADIAPGKLEAAGWRLIPPIEEDVLPILNQRNIEKETIKRVYSYWLQRRMRVDADLPIQAERQQTNLDREFAPTIYHAQRTEHQLTLNSAPPLYRLRRHT